MKKIFKKGLLLSFEGIDGCGKSTLAKSIYQVLSKEYQTVLTKEPGATDLGKKLRAVLLEKNVPVTDKAEFLLFAADRAQHFAELILPALEKGTIVISDRMADSSVVYQGYGRKLCIESINQINNWAMCNREPDFVFYLKISADDAYKRMEKRGIAFNSFEKETAFIKTVSTGFDTLISQKSNVITLDATNKPEILVNQVLEKISQLL